MSSFACTCSIAGSQYELKFFLGISWFAFNISKETVKGCSSVDRYRNVMFIFFVNFRV